MNNDSQKLFLHQRDFFDHIASSNVLQEGMRNQLQIKLVIF